MHIIRHAASVLSIGAGAFGTGLIVARHAGHHTIAMYALPIAAGATMFIVGLCLGWNAGSTSLVRYPDLPTGHDPAEAAPRWQPEPATTYRGSV